MSKKRPVEFELEEGGTERHQQDVGGGQTVDRQVAERWGGVEDDEVVLVEDAVALEGAAQGLPQLPGAQGHAPDRDLELGPVEVQLGADQVDVRPVGLADDVGGGLLQGGVEGFVEGERRLAALDPAAVLGLQPEGVVAGDEGEDRIPLGGDAAAEDRGHRALAVEIDDEHAIAVEGSRHREVGGHRGLADAALEVGDRRDLGRQPGWAPWGVGLGAGPLGGKVGAQAQHLVEGEPLGAARRLGTALGEGGVGAEDAAEVGLGDGDQIAGDLPGREEPQGLAAARLVAAAGEVVATAGAGFGDRREVAGTDRRAELGERLVGGNAEVGRQRLLGVLGHPLVPHVPCFGQCTTIRGTWNINRYAIRFFEADQGVFGASEGPSGSGQGPGKKLHRCYFVLERVLRVGAALPSR